MVPVQYMCDFVESWKTLDSKTRQKGAILAWCIWGDRNQKIFENKITPNAVLIERVNRLAEEQGKYAARNL